VSYTLTGARSDATSGDVGVTTSGVAGVATSDVGGGCCIGRCSELPASSSAASMYTYTYMYTHIDTYIHLQGWTWPGPLLWFTYVYDDVTYVYDDVTYVYDDVTYGVLLRCSGLLMCMMM
jgi:hypothetical protein